MERYIKPIGGEFWFEDIILNNSINNFSEVNSVLLNGGQSAIEFILQNIDLKKHEYILMPLAFPVLVNNRDYVRQELRKYNIYCPVHWDITEEGWAVNFQNSLEVSKSILSIPIDWRYDKKDMDYFLEKFNSILIE